MQRATRISGRLTLIGGRRSSRRYVIRTVREQTRIESMRFEAFSRRAAEQRGDCLVIGAFERGELGPIAAAVNTGAARPRAAPCSRAATSPAARTRRCCCRTAAGSPRGRLLLVGPGAARPVQPPRLAPRAAGRHRRARAHPHRLGRRWRSSARRARELDDYYFGRAIAEIAGSALYRINDLKSARRPRPPALARIRIGPVETAALAAVRRGLAAGEALAESARCCATWATCRPTSARRAISPIRRASSQRQLSPAAAGAHLR